MRAYRNYSANIFVQAALPRHKHVNLTLQSSNGTYRAVTSRWFQSAFFRTKFTRHVDVKSCRTHPRASSIVSLFFSRCCIARRVSIVSRYKNCRRAIGASRMLSRCPLSPLRYRKRAIANSRHADVPFRDKNDVGGDVAPRQDSVRLPRARIPTRNLFFFVLCRMRVPRARCTGMSTAKLRILRSEARRPRYAKKRETLAERRRLLLARPWRGTSRRGVRGVAWRFHQLPRRTACTKLHHLITDTLTKGF